ncbi:hypothetical protein DEO72_LG3g1728 [Vigna unguiculata]|uniref:Uncharacterized protein n=1 Tax=Vigna unguiculata TaxID=3917 RepID=A0A4D6LGA0_VIGUN|nr:hypothetical protein DEO72_LG3g1728 [Vigna unguiculata]
MSFAFPPSLLSPYTQKCKLSNCHTGPTSDLTSSRRRVDEDHFPLSLLGQGTMWSLDTSKGIVEIGKLGDYVTMPIILTFANNPRPLGRHGTTNPLPSFFLVSMDAISRT